MSAKADRGGYPPSKAHEGVYPPTHSASRPPLPCRASPPQGEEIGLRLRLGREPNEKAGRFRPASIIHTCVRPYLIIGSNSLTDFFASP